MDSLTEEQKARIAKNREEALRRLAERNKRLVQATVPPSSTTVTAATTATASTLATMNPTWPTAAVAKKPGATYSLFSNLPTKRSIATANGGANMAKQAFTAQLPTSTTNPTTYSTACSVVKVCFTVMNGQFIKINFSPFHVAVVDTIKTLPTRQYNEADRIWSVRFSDYEPLIAKLRTIYKVRVEVDELPSGVKMVFRDEICGRPNDAHNPTASVSSPSLTGIDETLVNSLFPYQQRGVMFGIEKGGRVLIADEMGLGKSVQALAIAQKFSAEWPLLIICPSSVKSAWRNQIQKFMPSIKDVYVIDKGSDVLPKSRSTSVIVIMSYDQMSNRLRELLEHSFYVVIFDESHLLKEMKAKRTKCALDISKKANRVILLSGTPALSRPVELYAQVKIINPKIFSNLQQFGLRYCDGKQGRYAFEMKGATNSEELVAILQKTVMIRRLKKDVLQDLPAKRREIIYLSGDSINHNMKCLKEARKALRSNISKNVKDKHETLMQYYVETGIVKSHSVAHHIVENYFYEGAERRKLLIFAHHAVVLDTVTAMIERKGIKYIRIDGGTPQHDRGRLCDEFQTRDDILVAILSITAAGVGITLTAASIVVFAELHWNPGSMLQAEDRAHRVGQRDSVLVQYMLAKNTADDEIWPLVERKLKMLGSVNLSNDSYKDAENLHRDCSDRAITTYMKKPTTIVTSKSDGGAKRPDVMIIDNDDNDEDGELEILEGDVLEHNTLKASIETVDNNDIVDDDAFDDKLMDSVIGDRPMQFEIDDDDNNEDVPLETCNRTTLSDTFNATGMSLCGGFDGDEEENPNDWIDDSIVVDGRNPKRGRH